MNNRTYYTLEEFMKVSSTINDKAIDSIIAGNNFVSNNEYALKLIAKELLEEDVLATSRNWMNETSGKLFCNYIVRKYLDSFVGYVDTDWNVEPTEDEINAMYRKFLMKLLGRIENHYDEYKKLIDLYDSIKNNLLDSITNVSKINLTPQTNLDGTTFDDSYQNQITTNESEVGTKIARLKEVETYIEDYYKKWCDEVCKGLFIYE